MSVYLVTYDLKKPGQEYTKLYEKIKAHPWAKLSESSYCIETAESALTVLESVRSVLDKNDTVYVIPLHSPYAGFGLKDVNDWLDSKLTDC